MCDKKGKQLLTSQDVVDDMSLAAQLPLGQIRRAIITALTEK